MPRTPIIHQPDNGESFDTLRTRALLVGSLELVECRKQPILMFIDGGTLCQKCGREVKNACERARLNDKWEENLTDEEYERRSAAMVG
jgi:hypothetical protein